MSEGRHNRMYSSMEKHINVHTFVVRKSDGNRLLETEENMRK
jgi:hypothetical protein